MEHVTYHAVEQFIRRWEPTKTYEQAEEELRALLRTSKNIGKTPAGEIIAVSGHRPEVRMVIKDRNVCVTVLPVSSLENAAQIYQEELEQINASNKENVKRIQQEISEYEKKVETINERRLELGKQKGELLNRIATLQNNLVKISNFTY